MKDRGTSNRVVVMLSWMALLLLGALAVAPLVPPAPLTDQDATAFSAARALDHIERFAVEPRPIGTPASARARGDIVAQLRLLGLKFQLQTTEVPNYFSAAGETIEQILDAHPRLTREGVQAALVHAHRAEAVVAGQGTFTSVPPMCLPAPPSPVWTDPRRSGSTT